MQIFSRQSAMMDALISHFTEQMKRRKDSFDANVAAGGAIDPSIDVELNGNYNPLFLSFSIFFVVYGSGHTTY
jgi:hypothetical protein